MSTLVFDIKTVGESWLDFDEVTKEELTNWITKQTRTKADHEKELEEVKNKLKFSPLTGEIVALGMWLWANPLS